MSIINTNIASSFLKFTFTDEDGDVVSSFRLNPADVKLSKRCHELSAFFAQLEKEMPDETTLNDVIAFNDKIEEKFCYLLGYDVKDALFGQIPATTIMGDGNMFALHVMEKIIEATEPELAKRKNSMASAAKKHTGKYKK